MNRTRAFAALLCMVAFAACDKNAVQVIDGPETGGVRIKFFNFGVNAPNVNFFLDETKMTATVSSTGVEATTGVGYGSVGSGGYYASTTPGAYSLTGRITATVDKNLSIATLPVTLVDGVSYSYYMSGFYNTTTKVSDGFIVQDGYPAEIDFANAYVRFVHASSNALPLQLIATRATPALVDTIGALVAYKNAGAFEAVSPGVYDLALRYAATGTNAVTRTAVSFVAGRVYTITLRGDITVVSTTATNRPFLDNTANR